MTTTSDQPSTALEVLRSGTVIPAHPLALTADRRLDPVRQRALSRYYLDAGAGGLAVGVHTTQFAIRQHGLFEPVLEIAAQAAREWTDRPVALVAGVVGDTPQALQEARTARTLGYDAVILNVAGWKGRDEREILEHCRAVAGVMPLIGFALLPEVGGFHLSYEFWREFATIPEVVAIKMAPFNRYRTLDIVRAVVDARAEERIALYTGNDDHIVLDLLQPFAIPRDGEVVTVHVRGGLLGHWSVWTSAAVAQFDQLRAAQGRDVPAALLALDSRVTDCNEAIYDAINDFAGCIPGCLEVLRRQGLVEGTWCLDPAETLSPGQLEEIERVYRSHPDLHDDEFVTAGLSAWLS
ncbi:MAG: dihydrodipicolinate synthase family protein [Micrococcales bacterium 70-64]|nr:dihydrodipicolinate synthase family protein [Leifsonia sp.]ODU65180.1 MAG: dihydrodipicolinate synthase family protein [Leifsonia sp. SCN 70-46]OJX86872.1 MAG: dihydrodipicolinate synthase family protein [Micrococcales bacterium 70-64]